MNEPKLDPMLDRVADAEVAEHAARREVEALRELLSALYGLVREAIELPADLVAKIDAALRG